MGNGKISVKWAKLKDDIRTDENLTRARRGIVRGAKGLPSATGRYMIQKVPVVQWLPRYSPRWIFSDFIAGVTVGLLMIPQALAYAALAGLPMQVGLIASWIPSALYFFQGTSKDISTGPTSIIGLLTGQIVAIFSRGGFPGAAAGVFPPAGAATTGMPAPGVLPPMGAFATGSVFPRGSVLPNAFASGTGSFMALPTGGAFPNAAAAPQAAAAMAPGALSTAFPPLPPALVAAVVAVSVGILALIMGVLKLGWMLDFISLPVLIGFIMGSAIIIIQGQVPTLLGEEGVSPIFVLQGKDIITKIGTAKPLTIAIGASGIVILLILQFIGKKWGKKNHAIWVLSISRNIIVLVLFTGISFAVNRDLETPLWEITGTIPSGLQPPRAPPIMLILVLTFVSFPVFIAAAVEHVAIAKSFGHINGYAVDQSQELVFLGVANTLNGIFGGMPVGGTLSRTAVNSESGVKSPLGGIFTSAIVLLGIFPLNGALFWIPKATLSAIIVVVVINILPPVSVMRQYWKTSFADFFAFSITMQLTLVATAEQGIGFGVAFMVIYTLIRTVYARARPITRYDLENQYTADPAVGSEKNYIPSGTQVMAFNQAIIFLNAYRVKQDIMDTVQTYHSGIPAAEKTRERSWNDLSEQHIAFLRKKANLGVPTKLIPRIRVLILDFTQVTFIDTTGMQMMREMKAELLAYGGEDVELRFVGMNDAVKKRFERAGWHLATSMEDMKGFGEGKDVLFELLKPAIEAPRTVRDSGLDFGFGNVLMSDAGSFLEGGGDEEKGQRVIVTQVGVKGGKAFKE